MSYSKISDCSILIGEKRINYPKLVVIDQILQTTSKIILTISPSETDMDWNMPSSHELWRKRVQQYPPELHVYDFHGNLSWKFSKVGVVGFELEIPERKKESDFISTNHYLDYVNTYKGKELLLVYAGDFVYRVDANTGEIFGKTPQM